MKKLARTVFCIMIFLSACSSGAGSEHPITINTGPSVHAGPVEIGLHLNSAGKFVLEGGVSVPIIGDNFIGVTWDAGFETVLNEAQNTHNYLYLMWEHGDGTVYQDAYDIGQPFSINFEHQQWVRRISSDEYGNIIVQVEIQDMGKETYPCYGTVDTRVGVGQMARVTVTDNHLPLRIRSLPIAESWTYITSLDEGTEMRILDGPACYGGWTWWKVQTDDGYTGWVSEGDGVIWFIEPE